MTNINVGLELEAPFVTSDQLYWLEQDAPKKSNPSVVTGHRAVYHQDGVSLEVAQQGAYDTAGEAVDNLLAAYDAAVESIGLGAWGLGQWGNNVPAGMWPRVRELGCAPDLRIMRGTVKVRRAPDSVVESPWRDAGCHVNVDLPEHVRMDLLCASEVWGASVQAQAQAAHHPRVIRLVTGFQALLREHFPAMVNPNGATWYRAPNLFRLKSNDSGAMWVELRSAPSVILADPERASALIASTMRLANDL